MILPKLKKGFTLIEILLVVAILSILLVVVFAALNPASRLQDTRNARRWNDVNQILTAVHECIVDNDGSLATCGGLDALTDGTTYEIVDTGVVTGCDAACGAATDDCVSMQTALQGTYMADLPQDPGGAATGHTSYGLTMSSGLVSISACSAEGGETIQVSR